MQDAKVQPGGSSSTLGIHVREAERLDAIAVSALLKRAFMEFETLYTPEAFAATVLPESGVFARLAEGPVWVAERDSLLVGTVGVVCRPESVLVRGMAVDPQARGLGIGKILLRAVENFAREHGYDRISLYTTEFLARAIGLYQSSGFEFTGETIHPHGTKLLGMVKTVASDGNSGRTRPS